MVALHSATSLRLLEVNRMQKELAEVFVRKLPPFFRFPVRDDMDRDRELRYSFSKVQDRVVSECATMDNARVPHMVEKDTGKGSGTQRERERARQLWCQRLKRVASFRRGSSPKCR